MFHPLDQPMDRGWVGRIDGDHVVQLAAQTLQSFFTGGGTAREHAVYPLAGVRLLAPVLHPPSVRVFDAQSTFWFANPAAIVPPGALIAGRVSSDTVSQGTLALLPRLAAVVGASEEIAGYTIASDWRRTDLAPPKDRDFGIGLGPVVVTHDELDPSGLEAIVRVESVGRPASRFDGFDWPAARDLASVGTTLYPGDLLVGPALDAVQVRLGSPVELEVREIGVLDASTGSA